MARPCSICTHPNRTDIDKGLINGQKLRSLAESYGVTSQALIRHRDGHLPQFLAENLGAPAITEPRADSASIPEFHAVVVHAEERRQAAVLHVSDVLALVRQSIGDAMDLRQACRDWLADPDDPRRLSIEPRDTDVTVIYLDWQDTKESGDPKRKKAKLSALLERVEAGGREEPITSVIRQSDPRELLLKVLDATEKQLSFLVNLADKIHSAQQIAAFQEAVVQAIAEASPETKERIEQALRKRAALAGIGR